jgi:hypothetical protein
LRTLRPAKKTINLGISCKTQEGVKGHIISYIHQPDGIYFAWHDDDGLSFFFTKKEFNVYYHAFIMVRNLHREEYIDSDLKKWLQEAMRLVRK